MEWAFSQIRYWVAIHTSSTIVLAYLVGRTDCRSKILWLGWCLQYSFSSLQSNFLHQRDQNKGVRTPYRHQGSFFVPNELCSAVPSNRAQVSVCRELTFVANHSLGIWGLPWTPPWTPTQWTATQFCCWEPCLATRDDQLRFCILQY